MYGATNQHIRMYTSLLASMVSWGSFANATSSITTGQTGQACPWSSTGRCHRHAGRTRRMEGRPAAVGWGWAVPHAGDRTRAGRGQHRTTGRRATGGQWRWRGGPGGGGVGGDSGVQGLGQGQDADGLLRGQADAEALRGVGSGRGDGVVGGHRRAGHDGRGGRRGQRRGHHSGARPAPGTLHCGEGTVAAEPSSVRQPIPKAKSH